MNTEEQLRICKEWAARLACVIYNGEDWSKEELMSYFHMGEESFDYIPSPPLPTRLTEDDFVEAMDGIFARFKER